MTEPEEKENTSVRFGIGIRALNDAVRKCPYSGELFVTRGITIYFLDERTNREQTFYFEGGITSFVRYLNRNECDQLAWGRTAVVLVLDNGTTVYPARDAEGNDAGALHGVSKSGEGFVLPELNVG